MAAEQDRQLAVVTGASSGIGFELAKVFAEEGRQMAEPGSAEGESR